MSNATLRIVLRVVHIIAGVSISLYIYSPLGADPTYRTVVQVFVIPLVVITGIAMWQQPRIAKAMRAQRN